MAQAATGTLEAVPGHPCGRNGRRNGTHIQIRDQTARNSRIHHRGGRGRALPKQQVVWSDSSKGHSFHPSTSRYFGKTKHGAYVCESDALAAGFHQAKS